MKINPDLHYKQQQKLIFAKQTNDVTNLRQILLFFGSTIKQLKLSLFFIRMGCGQSSATNDKVIHPLSARPSDKDFQTTIVPSTLTKNQSVKEPNDQKNPKQKKARNSNSKLSKSQIQQAYDSSGGNLQKMFDQLSQRISEYYMKLSIDAVELLSQHKLNQVQTKVFLSEQFLLLAFDIFKVVGEKTNYQFQIDLFKNFNKSQNVLIGYLKQKYPRAGNIFVPGDMNQVFKDFNMCDDNPENDLLRKAGICFTDSSNEQIIKKLKLLFNTLLEQLDAKFPIFQSLLQDRAFYYQVQGKKKSLNYKIGRKIPQNTAKYQLDQTQQLTINSPEVFRMIIKWITDMQSNINIPDEFLSQKSTFKTYNIQKQQLHYDQVTSDEVQQLVQALINKIKGIKGSYKQELERLLVYMDMFNVNLIKILYTTERKQKFVPEKQANVIKFAMYNTKLVSWLVAEKLIMVLKNLINVGIQMQSTQVARKIDLVKFNVKDLFRAMVVGTKKEILAVYSNLKALQSQGKMKIVQIRSRLGTPLNDIMIIFTFKESFMLCQLQLVLSEGQGVSEKVKSIQVMNHFLYEMVRSPYGVLSQVAVLLGYKDNKINYQQKITFVNKYFEDFKTCEQKHKQSIINQKIQKKPIICTQCTQFYHPFQNILGLKMCQKCNIYQCCRCSFEKSKNMQQNQVHQRFIQQLQYQMSQQNARKNNFNSLSKIVTIDDVLKVFHQKKHFFNTIFKKNFQKISPKDVHGFIKKYYVDEIMYGEMYFLIVQFKGTNTNIKVYTWNNNLDEIQNCFNQKQNFYELDRIGWSYYDFIIILNKDLPIIQFKSLSIQNSLKFCFKPDAQFVNIKKVRTILIPIASKQIKPYLIIKIQQTTVANDVDNEYQIETKKQFVFSSIAQARKSLPSVALVQQNFQMKNFGLTTALLENFFSKPLKNPAQKSKIRILNLHNNKITDISVILAECIYAQSIMVSKNFIKTIQIKHKLQFLTKFILFDNKITNIKGFDKIPSVKKINIEENFLPQTQVIKLEKLRELLLSNNLFVSFTWLQNSKLPLLQNLTLNTATGQSKVQTQYSFTFPKLKSFQFRNNSKVTKLTLECPQLKYIDCNNSQMKVIQFISSKLQIVIIQQNKLQNLSKILSKSYPKLKKLEANRSGKVEQLPKINAENLQYLNLQNCQLKSVKNLQFSQLPSLQQLNLNYNQITEIPEMNLLKLNKLSIQKIPVNNINQFSKGIFPLLQILQIEGNIQIQIDRCPKFNFPSLKKMKFISFSFKNMDDLATSKLPNLERLQLNTLKVKQIAQFSFENLKYLILNSCNIDDLTKLNKSFLKNVEAFNIFSLNNDIQMIDQQKRFKRINLPRVKDMVFYNCKSITFEQMFQNKPELQNLSISVVITEVLPILNLPKLKKLSFTDSQLIQIKNLAKSNFQSLVQLQLQSNKILIFPKITLNNLIRLSVKQNQIKQLSNLSLCNFPKLEQLILQSNKLEQFPIINFTNLKTVSIESNPFKDLTGLTKSKLINLTQILLFNHNDLKQKQLPVLNFPKMTKISINSSNIQYIKNLEKSNLPSLTQIFLQYTNIRQIPLLRLPKLSYFMIQGMFDKYQEKLNEQMIQNKEGTNVNQRKQDENNTQSKNLKDQNQKPKVYHLTEIQKMTKWQCPELENIIITKTKISRVPILNLPKLKSLDLKDNLIQDSSNLKKSKLPSLQCIDLSNNPLIKIDIFSNFTFESIDYSSCQFESLSEFGQFTATSLSMNNSKLKKITKINLKETCTLNLQINQIQDVTSWLTFVPKLQYLNLRSNKIKQFPFSIDFLQLRNLDISQNLLTQITLKNNNFPELNNATLRNNQIEKVGQISTRQLQYLDLSQNRLTKINFFKKQFNMENLQEIQFMNNQIEKIEYIPPASNIYLGQNKLKNLDWIPGCDTQRWSGLFVNNNQLINIQGLSHQKTNLSSLWQIGLNNNQIKVFCNTAKLPSLTNMDLNNNQIQILDKIQQKNFNNLNNLQLSNNKLRKVGPNISIANLNLLQLNDNPELSGIEGFNSQQLYQIKMQRCKVADLKWLNKLNCPKITTLYFSQNKISKVPKIDRLQLLNNLDLQSNPLEDVQQFLKSPFLTKVSYFTFNFTLKEQLSQDVKKQIDQKIKIVIPSASWMNPLPNTQEEYKNNEENNQNAQNVQILGLQLDNIPNGEVISQNK